MCPVATHKLFCGTKGKVGETTNGVGVVYSMFFLDQRGVCVLGKHVIPMLGFTILFLCSSCLKVMELWAAKSSADLITEILPNTPKMVVGYTQPHPGLYISCSKNQTNFLFGGALESQFRTLLNHFQKMFKRYLDFCLSPKDLRAVI